MLVLGFLIFQLAEALAHSAARTTSPQHVMAHVPRPDVDAMVHILAIPRYIFPSTPWSTPGIPIFGSTRTFHHIAMLRDIDKPLNMGRRFLECAALSELSSNVVVLSALVHSSHCLHQ
jgi:hypothetical protein